MADLEQVFMTRRDILTCVHEPFGDAFYFGPERLSTRYESDEKAREESGFANSTFKTILDRIEQEGKEVRLSFILVVFPWLSNCSYRPFSFLESKCFETLWISSLLGMHHFDWSHPYISNIHQSTLFL
jgi:hypothetical protein